MKSFIPSILIVFAILLAGGVSASAADDVTIPIVISLSGPAAFVGQEAQITLRVMEGIVNGSGGIRGRKVHFDYLDDQSNPQITVQLVNGLIAKKAPVFLGPGYTGTCQAVAPLVDQSGPVSFCLSPSIFPRPDGYMFMTVPSLDTVQPVLFRYLVSRKLTKIALVTSTDAMGADFDKRLDGVLSAAEFKDIKIVAHEHFATSDISVAAQIARVKAAAPDVLISFTIGSPFGTLLKGIHDAGLEVPVFGSGGNFSYAQMQQYAAFLPQELILNGTRGITPDPTSTGAVKRAQTGYFAALAKAGVRSDFLAAIPWDPMNIILEAMRRAGPEADAQQLHGAMESIKGYSGIEGTYNFTTKDQRGLGESSAALYRYDKTKSEFIQIYPTTR